MRKKSKHFARNYSIPDINMTSFSDLICIYSGDAFYLHTKYVNKMSYTYQYPRPSVTGDCIVITREADPKVLLIQRKNDPFKGHWAFPGGFLDMDETTDRCAIRELKEETGIEVAEVKQIGAYSKVDRDPRGRTITVAYLAVVDNTIPAVGLDDAAKAEWFSLQDLPPLAFDHDEILADAVKLFRTL